MAPQNVFALPGGSIFLSFFYCKINQKNAISGKWYFTFCWALCFVFCRFRLLRAFADVVFSVGGPRVGPMQAREGQFFFWMLLVSGNWPSESFCFPNMRSRSLPAQFLATLMQNTKGPANMESNFTKKMQVCIWLTNTSQKWLLGPSVANW